MQSVRKLLEELGFSERETDIYLTLLPLCTSLASTLAKRTGMTRSTAQYTCQQLVRKGILSQSQKGNTFLYSAEPPEKLISLVFLEEQKLGQKKEKLERSMSKLKSLVNPENVLPKIQFFEGVDGIFDLYQKIYALEQPIDSVESGGAFSAFMPDAVEHFSALRIEKRIPKRVICPEGSPLTEASSENLLEVHTLSPETFPFTCDIKICNQMASIVSFDEQTAVGIAIRHVDIVQNFRLIFENIWHVLVLRDSFPMLKNMPVLKEFS